MGFRKTDIAGRVFAVADSTLTTPVTGGPVNVKVVDLAALAVVPWFGDPGVQWAVRITDPSGPLKNNAIPKIPETFVGTADGSLLIGVPGEGVEPPAQTLRPLAEVIFLAAASGSKLELAAANPGVSQHHLYVGTIGDGGTWTIQRSTPAITRADLEAALDRGRSVVGPVVQ
jgi:hypothetical protein